MYSVVLATMLTAGSATPAWGFGCHGCQGCHGCSGNAFSCGGCYGCCGGCWGCSGCYGCGGCWGCGGCYGGGYWGCAGYNTCYSCSSCYGYLPSAFGCAGCYGGVGAHGGGMMRQHVPPPPAPPPAGKKVEPEKKTGATAQPARVTVQLPADAKLYVDGVLCPLTSGTRTIETPSLPPGQKFVYTLRAEAVRNGETRAESRKVMLEAGKPVTVEFADLKEVATVRR